MPSELRTDILPESLTTPPVRVQVHQQFNNIIQQARSPFQGSRQTPENAKSLTQVMELILAIIQRREQEQGIAAKDRVQFTEEYPDFTAGTERIVFTVVKSEPGAFGKGAPMEGDVRNLVPILRQELEDEENPGYKIAVLGYWLDHIVRLTCFARTNKAANRRALWLQQLIRDYNWYLRWMGVGRFLFLRRGEDFILEEQGQKLFGRPMDFFVRTEELSQVRERTLELVIIQSMQTPGTTELSTSLIDNSAQSPIL